MDEHKDIEKRKYNRLTAQYIISYRDSLSSRYDITQTRDVSQGGASFTTSKQWEKGKRLIMNIRIPFINEKIEVSGEIISSQKIKKSNIYETRVKFLNLNDASLKKLGEFAEAAKIKTRIYTGPERREIKRHWINLMIRYRAKGDFDRCYNFAPAKNISAGGTIINTDKPYAKGIILSITMKFSLSAETVELNGEVVECKEIIQGSLYENRIKFIDMNEDNFKKLTEFFSE